MSCLMYQETFFFRQCKIALMTLSPYLVEFRQCIGASSFYCISRLVDKNWFSVLAHTFIILCDSFLHDSHLQSQYQTLSEVLIEPVTTRNLRAGSNTMITMQRYPGMVENTMVVIGGNALSAMMHRTSSYTWKYNVVVWYSTSVTSITGRDSTGYQ